MIGNIYSLCIFSLLDRTSGTLLTEEVDHGEQGTSNNKYAASK
jgi:hypothetical protein